MKKYAFFAVSLCFVLAANLYFRSFPINFPQFKSFARQIVKQKILDENSRLINDKFPNFSELAKDTLTRAAVSDFERKNKRQINNQINQEYLKLKNRYQDPKGQTYLMELDGWNWARYVDNIIRLGHPGDQVIGGRQFDKLMLAPSGSFMSRSQFLFYYLSAYLYKIFYFFKPVALFAFLFYLPLLFIAVFIITLYLFSYRLYGNIAAFISCLFVGLAPILLPRSCAGWFDTDTLNIFFPLLIAWAYLRAYNYDSYKPALLFIFISSFFVGLFCLTWNGWWFILLIIIAYEMFCLANLASLYYQYKENTIGLLKTHILFLIVFLFASSLWIFAFSGFQPFIYLVSFPKEILSLNKSVTVSIWPNTFSTVGELRKPDFLEIAYSTGGILFFLVSLGSLLVLFLKSRDYKGIQREARAFLVIWFIIIFLVCFRGVRFTLFLVLPMAVAFGCLSSQIYRYFKNKNRWIFLAVIFVIVGFSIGCLFRADKTANNLYPLMNDGWYNFLVSLKNRTPQESVINSWWDFGDWFKAVSNRKVIFDGQTQNSPRAYWMAKVLISQDEEQAVRILRMLNNGEGRILELINSSLGDQFKSALLLEKIIQSDSLNAKKILTGFLPLEKAEEVIKLIFIKKPAKSYFVVDYTLIEKMAAISYLGNWDLEKVYIEKNSGKDINKSRMCDFLSKPGLSRRFQDLSKEVKLIAPQDFGDWASHQINFYGGPASGQEKEGVVFFDNGLVYDISSKSVNFYSPREKRFIVPKSLFLYEKDKLKEIENPANNMENSVMIFKQGVKYYCILLDRDLAGSLFMRLYFLNGRDLRHFKPFIEVEEGQNRIKAFEIFWD